MSNGQYPPPPPSSAMAPKQGIPGWAKGLIACGCLVLLAGVVFLGFSIWAGKKAIDTMSDPAKMAEFLINANPDLEVVENNRDAGTITVRDKTTGDVTTFNYSDIQSGKFSIEGTDGKTVTVDGSQLGQEGGNLQVTGPDGEQVNIATAGGDTPSWVPLYPNVKETTPGYNATVAGKTTGVVTQTTTDSVATVKKHYEDLLARDGYKIQGNFSGGMAGQDGTLITAEKDGKSLTVTIGTSGTDTSISLTYIQ